LLNWKDSFLDVLTLFLYTEILEIPSHTQFYRL